MAAPLLASSPGLRAEKMPLHRVGGGGWESRANLWLDSWVTFLTSLRDVGVGGPLRASVGCRGGTAFWELAVWRVSESPQWSCSALGTMALGAPWTWWCSAPSALREVDLPPWAHPLLEVDPPPWALRHSVAGHPPRHPCDCWGKCQPLLACCRCCSSRQPASICWEVEASSVVPRSSSRSCHSIWALTSLCCILLYQADLVSSSPVAQRAVGQPQGCLLV